MDNVVVDNQYGSFSFHEALLYQIANSQHFIEGRLLIIKNPSINQAELNVRGAKFMPPQIGSDSAY